MQSCGLHLRDPTITLCLDVMKKNLILSKLSLKLGMVLIRDKEKYKEKKPIGTNWVKTINSNFIALIIYLCDILSALKILICLILGNPYEVVI